MTERGKEEEGGEASQSGSLLEIAGFCTANMYIIEKERHSQRY